MSYVGRFRRWAWWGWLAVVLMDMVVPFFPLVPAAVVLGLFAPPVARWLLRRVDRLRGVIA